MALFDAFRCDGKRVLVVGGATGMGAAAAEVALDAGAEGVEMDYADVKLPGAKLSHAQEAEHRRIKEASGIVAVVHDVEEALAVVDRLTPNFEL